MYKNYYQMDINCNYIDIPKYKINILLDKLGKI